MAEMLLRDLTISEQMALASLAQHRGFDVLTSLMEEACRIAAAKPVQLDPLDDKYEQKLAKLTLVARATNDFCESIRKAVNTHISAAVAKQNEVEIEAQIENDAERVLTTVKRAQTQTRFENEE